MTRRLAATAALSALVLLTLVAGPATAQSSADFTLSVSPTDGLAEEDIVTVSVSGVPDGQGVYVRLCAAAVDGGRPAECDGQGIWVIEEYPYGPPPANVVKPSAGAFELPVRVAFGDVDCRAVQCGIATRRDHRGGADTSLDTFTPLRFASGLPSDPADGGDDGADTPNDPDGDDDTGVLGGSQGGSDDTGTASGSRSDTATATGSAAADSNTLQRLASTGLATASALLLGGGLVGGGSALLGISRRRQVPTGGQP